MDEFIELYNNSDAAITVCTADQSNGWAVAARAVGGASASVLFVVPYGTIIPARGHYLAVNNTVSGGYSLSSYPAGADTTTGVDIAYTMDIADDSGIALFDTAIPANFTLPHRLDAVGFSGVPAIYCEGSPFSSTGVSVLGQYSFVRKLNSGYPQDADNNASDFVFVSTDGASYSGMQSQLGAPGPEGLISPVNRSATIKAGLVDPFVSSTVAPNRVRGTTPVTNGVLGTLTLRRKFTNNTGQAVSRLRFRVIDITTLNTPGYTFGGTQADVRVLNSADVTVTTSSGASALVRGTLVEQLPAQSMSGGLNSSLTLQLPGGALTPGATVNVQFVLGIQQDGNYRFTFIVEALP